MKTPAPVERRTLGERRILTRRTPAVLVVDDERDIRIVVSEILKSYGLDAFDAIHGEHALRRLLIEHIEADVLLVDTRMPVMDGREFRRRQLCTPKIAQIPFVAFTGDEASAPPGVPVVLKPPKIAEMIDTIAAVIETDCEKGAHE